jgi:hypothetical protein
MHTFVRTHLLQTIVCTAGVAGMAWALVFNYVIAEPGNFSSERSTLSDTLPILLFAIGPYLLFLLVPGRPWISTLLLLGILWGALTLWENDPGNWGLLGLVAASLAAYLLVFLSLAYGAIRRRRTPDPFDLSEKR